MNILLLIIMIVFGVASLLCVVRIIRGPSILDRAVASDVLLTLVMCVLGAEMAIHGHTRKVARYRCSACGFKARQFQWRCPACGGWETYPPRRTEEFDLTP